MRRQVGAGVEAPLKPKPCRGTVRLLPALTCAGLPCDALHRPALPCLPPSHSWPMRCSLPRRASAAVDTSGAEIEGSSNPSIRGETLVLFHYAIKSEQEYREKMARGEAGSGLWSGWVGLCAAAMCNLERARVSREVGAARRRQDESWHGVPR